MVRAFYTVFYSPVSSAFWRRCIEAFVCSSAEFTDALKRFPSLNHGSLATDFHKTVFKPRNKILHQGIAAFTETDANKVCSIADLGLGILLAMDIEKRKTMP